MSPKSVSFTNDDKPQQAPPSGAGSPQKRSRPASPFPDLSTLRKGWHSQLKDIPAMPVSPVASNPVPAISASTGPRPEKLPEMPRVQPMAALVSSSLLEPDDLSSEPHDPGLNPFPAQDLPARSAILQREDHIWKPEITHQIPKETSPPVPDYHRADRLPQQPFPDTASSSSRSALVAKIRRGPAAQSSAAGQGTKTSQAKPRKAPEPDQTAAPFAEALPASGRPGEVPEFTDKDLRDALLPLMEPSIDHLFHKPQDGIRVYLEPLLRNAVRSAIAEQMAEKSPFRDVSRLDKLAWKLRALMTSRTYEDVLFDHTRRYQVEEAFLLRPKTRTLISYASHNPARHAKSSKVEATVRKIATKTANIATHEGKTIKWEDNRQLVIRPGKHTLLAAIVHGCSNAVLEADLDYILSQVEERLGKSLEHDQDIHLQILQPMLECCLLIQSLASPDN